MLIKFKYFKNITILWKEASGLFIVDVACGYPKADYNSLSL